MTTSTFIFSRSVLKYFKLNLVLIIIIYKLLLSASIDRTVIKLLLIKLQLL